MAKPDNRGPINLPYLIVSIALLVAGVTVANLGLETLRPKRPQTDSFKIQSIQDVDTRLWQDPFESCKKNRSLEHDKGHSNVDKRTFEILHQHIRERLNDGFVILCPVMVRAGPYAEDSEQVQRTRYAVLSGLSEEGFIPFDERHIGYLSVQSALPSQLASGSPARGQYPEGEQREIPEIIPFEWLEKAISSEAELSGQEKAAATSKESVLVLWLDESAFYLKPLESLEFFLELLVPFDLRQMVGKGMLSKSVIGPMSSKVLKQMTDELNPPDRAQLRQKRWEQFLSAYNVRFFSPSATVDASHIMSKKFWEVDEKNDERKLQEVFDNRFFRISRPDYQLLNALLHELKLRDAYPGKITRSGVENYVVILSEWDTYYGRHLPGRFVELVQHYECGNQRECQSCGARLKMGRTAPGWWNSEKVSLLKNGARSILEEIREEICIESPECRQCNQCFKGAEKYIKRFSYLRGLDGEIPAGRMAEKDGNNQDGEEKSKPSGTLTGKAIGASQFDYLKRLTGRITRCIDRSRSETKAKVAAIGILGSDVYDKLLLLQALRARFQEEVFFTTDLDALLIDPKENPWTRNLIVASSFGLQLHPDLQGMIPPFRDTHQVAAFLAARLSVDRMLDFRQTGELIQNWSQQPVRIFEIGRSDYFELTRKSGEISNTHLKEWTRIHPDTPPFFIFSGSLFFLLSAWTVFLGILLIKGLFSTQSVKRPPPVLSKTIWVVPLAITSIVVIGFLFKCHQAFVEHESGSYSEPFLWFEGISVWPTELLRLTVFVLAAWFILFSHRTVVWDMNILVEKYKLPRPEKTPKGGAENKKRSLSELLSNILNAGDVPHSILENCRIWPRVIWQRFTLPIHSLRAPFFVLEDLKRNGEPLEMAEIFSRYCAVSGWWPRMIRVVFCSVFYLLIVSPLFVISEIPQAPVRGYPGPEFDRLCVMAAVLGFNLLLFFVVDISRVSAGMVDLFSLGVHWPEELFARKLENFESQPPRTLDMDGKPSNSTHEKDKGVADDKTNRTHELFNEWFSMDFLANHTERIGRLIYYPFILWILLVISRVRFFDNWVFPTTLVVVMVMSGSILVFCTHLFQKKVQRLRDQSLGSLNEKLFHAKAHQNLVLYAAQIETLMDMIKSIRRGAFLPFYERPLVRSILVTISTYGGLELLNYFSFRAG